MDNEFVDLEASRRLDAYEALPAETLPAIPTVAENQELLSQMRPPLQASLMPLLLMLVSWLPWERAY